MLILQPEKVVTPDVTTPEQPDSVPGPPEAGVPLVIARVTVDESPVTMLPPASSTATFGWVVGAMPPVELDGDWVTAS